MNNLASVRASIANTKDRDMEHEQDSVQSFVLRNNLGLTDGDVEVGVEVNNPWHFDRINTDVKRREIPPRQVLKRASGKNPSKATPTLMSRVLNPFMSMFSYDPTISTKGVIMRPDSMEGSGTLSQDANYANSVQFRDVLQSNMDGRRRQTVEDEWGGREMNADDVVRYEQAGDYTSRSEYEADASAYDMDAEDVYERNRDRFSGDGMAGAEAANSRTQDRDDAYNQNPYGRLHTM